jgi:type II secretory pathway pseudopilin PulG
MSDPHRRTSRKGRREQGGLLIILMVWVAIMSIFAGVAYQSWSIVWRRDNEEELIFRGHQYVDALIAYRREHNKQFPGTLDELIKPGPRQVRYIRKLFRDPMTHNGKWGLLYLMPGGTAIYDPVAAQKGKAEAAEAGQGGLSDDARLSAPGATPGVTPIMTDPNGAMGGMAGMNGVGGQQVMGGAMGMGSLPSGGGFGQGMRSGPPAGALAGARTGTGSMGAFGGVMPVGSPTGMSLPPPKPPGGDADDKAASEPPIGWPIVGVISRINGKPDDDTYKIYEGHEHVSEWQFHVFEHPLDQGQAPTGATGAANPNCIGPGYGGCGPIGGIGGGLGNNNGGIGGASGGMPGRGAPGQRPGPGTPGAGGGFGGPGGPGKPPGGGSPP